MCLAVPGKVLEIIGSNPLLKKGKVSFAGIIKEINLVYVPEVKLNDYVLVHVGFAISIISEAEALKEFSYLEEINQS